MVNLFQEGPWKVASAMSQREEFVALAHSEGVNMSELCLRSEISRKTGYKWLSRYLEAGEQSLDDLPKRPHHSPKNGCRDLVVDLGREHPTKGGHVLARMSRIEDTIACRPRARSRPSSGDIDL